MTFQLSGDILDVFVRIEKKASLLTFSSVLYNDVPDSKLNKVAELITRLNAGCVDWKITSLLRNRSHYF